MSNSICVLEVNQHSELEQEIYCSKIISESYMVWEDTGTIVKYPIQSNTERKRKCVDRSYYELYFNLLASKHRDKIKFVFTRETPPWGTSWWASGLDGYIVLYKSNWDSSD